MMSKAALITDPNFIDFFVLARHHSFDDEIATGSSLTARVQRDVASHRTLRADRSSRFQFPGTRFETEIFGRQRADRADFCRVPGKDRVKSGVRERNNSGRTGAIIEPENRIPYDLILKTDAARTLDAAFLIEHDQIAERHTFSKAQLFIEEEAALAGTVPHRQILQRALAAFITDWTIQRMGCEQELNGASLPILCFRAFRKDDHALFRFVGTSRFKLGQELDLRRAILHHDLTCGAITHRTSDLH